MSHNFAEQFPAHQAETIHSLLEKYDNNPSLDGLEVLLAKVRADLSVEELAQVQPIVLPLLEMPPRERAGFVSEQYLDGLRAQGVAPMAIEFVRELFLSPGAATEVGRGDESDNETADAAEEEGVNEPSDEWSQAA